MDHSVAEAVDRLLASDYPITDLLAAAAATAGADTSECLAAAWERVVGAAGADLDGVRGALLEQLVTVLGERQLLDAAPVPAPPSPAFAPPGDRWAGWWADEPPDWPPDLALPGSRVIGALRRVPLGPRVLLVLRDAALISPQETEPIVNVPGPGQTALLDEARQAYVAAIDAEVAIGTADAPVANGTGKEQEASEPADLVPARGPIQASDVSCDVIVGLIGRWLDGDMDDADRDAYEQHLLFCPPCLVQTGKTRRALAALRTASAQLREGSAASAGDDLRSRLTRLASGEA